jgi:hypothetical protein
MAAACTSKGCSKCEGKTDHLPEMCSKNYEGSSKGMEAMGALRNVLNIFDSLDVNVREYDMDNVALTKTTLKHAHKTFLDASLFNMVVDWPRNKDGRKKEDRGQLPALHPILAFIADHNHQVHTYAKAYFLLVNMSQKKSKC